jgi:UDP-glucose 4-epimerase
VSGIRGILVTGGAGFIGATLVRRLAANGYRVRVIDNLSTGDAAHLEGVPADLMVGDIRDEAALGPAMDGCDAVVHLAAAGSVVASVADPAANFAANVVGTFLVLDAARRAGAGRVVLASTGGALIGDAEPPVDERSYGLRTVAVRFGNVYGPWCARKRGVFNQHFTALHERAPLVIYGDGSSSRDYVHVTDIASALQLAVENPDVPGGAVLHAASGVETTSRDLADLCRRAAGRPGHPIEHRPPRPGEVGRNFARYDLAHELLGYHPTVRIDEGVPELYKWFEAEVFAH